MLMSGYQKALLSNLTYIWLNLADLYIYFDPSNIFLQRLFLPNKVAGHRTFLSNLISG